MKRECLGWLTLLLLISGCDQPTSAPQSFASLGQDASAFKQVEREHPLAFPVDHGPHHGFRIEWWYVTANLKDNQGQDWGVQWTLFRSALRPGEETPGWSSPNLWMGHAALTSPQGHRSSETLARGGIGQAGVEPQPFRAWINDWSLHSTGTDGIAHLQMHATGKHFSYRLQLDSEGPLVLHGQQGYSEKSGQGQASYYYSQPFYRVKGEVHSKGQRVEVTGQAWLDREWSSQPLAAGQSGWDWFSLHLDDGSKVMLFRVRETAGQPYRAGTWINAQGETQPLQGEQIQLTELAWTTQNNGRKVPTRWRVQVPDHELDVQVEAVISQAWMDTSYPYWEGPVRLTGTLGGRGYLEMTGY